MVENSLKLIKGFSFVLMLGVVSCTSNKGESQSSEGSKIKKNTDITTLNFTAEEAPEWTALFKRTSGWFGADGIFAIPLNAWDQPGEADKTKTMFLFSDTLIGEIEDDKVDSTDYVMINNSVAIVDGAEPIKVKVQFYWDKDEKGNPESLFIPNTTNSEKGDYYWLGDGFVNTERNNDTYIFGYRVRNTSDKVFGFQEVGNTLIIIPQGSKPPFNDQRQIDTPFYLKGEKDEDYGSFGAGIFVNTEKAGAPEPDGYVYVYGQRGKAKNLLASRVLPKDFEKFDKWQFWDGQGWSADINKVANITDRVSNELSVTPLPDGRYALVFQTDGIGKTVGLRLGLSPVGPFGPIIHLWDCSKDVNIDKDFISYNAKVHSNLSKPDELLISYNVNSFDFFNDIKVHPNLYRPRFIKVKLLDK